MGKKLKTQEYNNKQHFLDDLNLIYSNCFMYNTAEDSIYRQHIQMLRDKWTYLLKSVPDIVVGKGVVSNENGVFEKKLVPSSMAKDLKFQTENITQQPKQQQSKGQVKLPTKQPILWSDPMDDLDDLLNAHLDSLSDSESCPSPKKLRKTSESINFPIKKTRSFFNELSEKFPKRCDKLMIKYASDFKASKQFKKLQSANNSTDNGSSFVFPELVYFYNTVPDTHLIKNSQHSISATNYCPIASMNKFHDNFLILQSIRALRKHLLEGSRAEVPSIEHLKIPSTRFDRLKPVFEERIEGAMQAKAVLRKVITLYLAQAGFERKLSILFVIIIILVVVISNSALHTLYELVDGTFTKLFSSLRLLNEEFGEEKDSADILRLSLLQMNLKHLSDLDVAMTESSFAKERLEHLLSVMCAKVDEYQLAIREEQDNDEEEDEAESSGNELDEADEDANEDNEDDNVNRVNNVNDQGDDCENDNQTDQEDQDDEEDEEDLENEEDEEDEVDED